VILMVGVGGDRFASSHVARSLDLAKRLPLADGDIVYLSPFHEQSGSAYARRAGEAGILSLSDADRATQYAALRDGIRRALPGVTVTRYDLREFVY
jgi:hypothetical protein